VHFQLEPLGALDAAARKVQPGPRCGLLFVGDCKSCSAVQDSYFQRQGVRCLPAASLALIGSSNPPLNGGVLLGTAKLMLRLYTRAATLAAGADAECRAMGRDQHLITAAGSELQQDATLARVSPVCLLPNDASVQAAAANLGINNDIRGMFRLDEERGVVVSVPLDAPVAILHQFDRRKALVQFLKRDH